MKAITEKYKTLFVTVILILVLIIAFVIGQFVVAPKMNKENDTVGQGEEQSTEQNAVDRGNQLGEIEWINQYETADNPWGFSTGIIDTEESTRAIFLMPDTGVKVKYHILQESLRIKYYVHPWMEETSDGLEFCIKINDSEEQYYQILKDEVAEENYLEIKVSDYLDTEIVIEIQNVNREDADLSGDWLIVEEGGNMSSPNKVNKLDMSFSLKDRKNFPTEDIPFEILVSENKPILARGNDGEWDSIDVLNPSVVEWNNQYFNYYSGFDGTTWRTGVAVSQDGYSWEKYENNPVFGIEDLKDEHTNYIAANGSAVIFNEKVYYFYQLSNPQGFAEIGLAISEDGYSFQDRGTVLKVDTEGTWESTGCADPYALVRDGAIYLYYLGMNEVGMQRLGVAVSRDGIEWVKSAANPILDIGTAGAFDENGLGEPSIYYQAPYFYMLYTGRNFEEERNIGLAVSYNGIDWRKLSYTGEFSQSEEWNSKVICDTTFFATEDKILVYYGGGDKAEPAENLNGQIGVFEVKLEQNRDMENWNANADWDISLVESESVLAGSYGIEGESGAKSSWCSAVTEIELHNNIQKDELYINGWLPVDSIHGLADVNEVTLRVYVNNEMMQEQTFSEDAVFEFVIPKNHDSEELSVKLEADSEINPSEYSDSLDKRALSYTLTCIEQR